LCFMSLPRCLVVRLPSARDATTHAAIHREGLMVPDTGRVFPSQGAV
jgi:hypothetical protein